MNDDIKFKSQNELFFKSYGNDLKIFGYASVFNVKDNEGDIVLPGAFYNSLKQNRCIKLLWQHKQDSPIGKLNKIYEDTKGLYIEGVIFSNLENTATARKMLLEKVVDSFSIGYTVEDQFFNQDTRFLKSINLFEVSIVTFPANPNAKIKIAF